MAHGIVVLEGRLTIDSVNGSGECFWDDVLLNGHNIVYLLDESGLSNTYRDGVDDYGRVRITIERIGDA